jgi:hypothetical protein
MGRLSFSEPFSKNSTNLAPGVFGCNLAVYTITARRDLAKQPSHNRLHPFCLGARRRLRGHVRQMIFSMKPMRVPNGETIFSSLALSLKSQESREQCIRKDLMQRLKPICDNMSSAEFEALVSKMTREQLRGEGAVNGKPQPS